MANLLELAELSSAVYETADLKRRASVGKWKCTDYKLASGSMNGFQAGMFVKDGQRVVAFRGTAQAMDGVADVKLGVIPFKRGVTSGMPLTRFMASIFA